LHLSSGSEVVNYDLRPARQGLAVSFRAKLPYRSSVLGNSAMASTTDNSPPKQRFIAEAVLVVLLLVLLLTGGIALRQLVSSSLPKGEPVVNPVPLAMLDSALLIFGSVAGLLYVFARIAGAWTAAVVVFQLATAASSLLAVQGAAALVWTPARGEFAGLINVVILLVAVMLPMLVAVIAVAVVCCLIAVRPRREEPLPKWVKLQVAVLVLLLVPAGFIVAWSAQNSPPARFQA
jgi:hypothetical protein